MTSALSGRAWLGLAAVLGAMAVAYWGVVRDLIDAWANDGNYSHGFLIVPLALFFAWERRETLLAAPARPSWLGAVVIAGSLLLLLAGLLGAEFFLTRISLIGTAAGLVLFLFGWAHLRILAFPLAFLLLMVPIPAIIFNQIAFPLQLIASQFGEFCIASARIPVLREGNVLILANTSLEVAEACSGIRSLVSLITLGLVYAYFTDNRLWVRTTIVLATIPVAIVANGARVAGTGMAAHWFGAEAATGFFHDFSGWAVFIVAFLMLLVVQKVVLWIAPAPEQSDATAAAAPLATSGLKPRQDQA